MRPPTATPTPNPSPPQVGLARLVHSSAKPGQARVSWGGEHTECAATVWRDSGSAAGRGMVKAARLSAKAEPRAALLRRRPRRMRVRRDEIIHRRLYAALLVRDAGERERHLGVGERAHEHAVVEVTEMADAEI